MTRSLSIAFTLTCLFLVGCTSIITYINNDNRHHNTSCDSNDASQGVWDVNGECRISPLREGGKK
ncbi:hypothetical protein [Vibrio sp. 10N.261.46.A3]|uniref:hypothetical protein n=1 Tax=Vibrio sp. 10N.261.46.A3 TaxID=3229658 RepID=UPI0035531568